MPRKRPRILPIPDQAERLAEDRALTKTAAIIVLSVVVNLLLFFYVAFATLVPTTMLIAFYLLSPLLGYFIFKKRGVPKAGLRAFAMFPLSLNLMLLINYLVSFNPRTETYTFKRNSETVFSRYYGARRQSNTKITLQGSAYDAYYGIRIFGSEEQIPVANKITYTFKTGVLGIRVMTDYRFE